MSPRKTILRELSRAPETTGNGYVRPPSIPGFSDDPEKYQKAVNELLKSRMLEGRRDTEGHMTIALNEHYMDDIRKELRPVWAKPTVWAVIVLVAALGAVVTI